MKRCDWVEGQIPLYIKYHDKEWGRPVRNSKKLFELLNLEAMQAGLSWITVLKKRDAYRELFDNFDPLKISKYRKSKLEKILKDERIIRNRLKVYAIYENSKAYLQIEKEFKSFSKYIWSFTDNQIVENKVKSSDQILRTSPISDLMSIDLKKRGFKFVGSTICYAFMQAAGIVNDHQIDCSFRK